MIGSRFNQVVPEADGQEGLFKIIRFHYDGLLFRDVGNRLAKFARVKFRAGKKGIFLSPLVKHGQIDIICLKSRILGRSYVGNELGVVESRLVLLKVLVEKHPADD